MVKIKTNKFAIDKKQIHTISSSKDVCASNAFYRFLNDCYERLLSNRENVMYSYHEICCNNQIFDLNPTNSVSDNNIATGFLREYNFQVSDNIATGFLREYNFQISLLHDIYNVFTRIGSQGETTKQDTSEINLYNLGSIFLINEYMNVFDHENILKPDIICKPIGDSKSEMISDDIVNCIQSIKRKLENLEKITISLNEQTAKVIDCFTS